MECSIAQYTYIDKGHRHRDVNHTILRVYSVIFPLHHRENAEFGPRKGELWMVSKLHWDVNIVNPSQYWQSYKHGFEPSSCSLDDMNQIFLFAYGVWDKKFSRKWFDRFVLCPRNLWFPCHIPLGEALPHSQEFIIFWDMRDYDMYSHSRTLHIIIFHILKRVNTELCIGTAYKAHELLQWIEWMAKAKFHSKQQLTVLWSHE